MGCWGYGNLQSDDALNWQDAFTGRAANVGYDSKGDPAVRGNRDALEGILDWVLSDIDAPIRLGDADADQKQRAVAYQVLATMLLASGCSLTEAIRQKLVDGVTNCGEYRLGTLDEVGIRAMLQELEGTQHEIDAAIADSRSEYVRERTAAISLLVVQLKGYDVTGGTPVSKNSTSLLETAAVTLGAPGAAQ